MICRQTDCTQFKRRKLWTPRVRKASPHAHNLRNLANFAASQGFFFSPQGPRGRFGESFCLRRATEVARVLGFLHYSRTVTRRGA